MKSHGTKLVAHFPDNDKNNEGPVIERDPLELNVRGLIVSWELIDGGRFMLQALDFSTLPCTYAIHAYVDNRQVAVAKNLLWHEVERLMHGAMCGRLDDPVAIFETVVQRINSRGAA